MIWSYAKLGTAPSLGFLSDVAAVALKQIGMFKAQELSSLLWAFAIFCFHPGTSLTGAVSSDVSKLLCPPPLTEKDRVLTCYLRLHTVGHRIWAAAGLRLSDSCCFLPTRRRVDGCRRG